MILEAARQSADSRLLSIAQAVFIHTESTTDDRIEAIAAINDIGDKIRFQQVWERLDPEDKSHPNAAAEYCRFLLGSGRPSKVIEFLATFETKTDELSRLRVEAQLQLSLDQDTGFLRDGLVGAIRLVEEGSDEMRLEILNRLARLPHSQFEPEEAQTLLEAIEKVADKSMLDTTLSFSLRIAGNPVRSTGLIDEAVALLLEEQIDSLCAWLLRNGEHEAILEHIDEVQAYRSAIAYEARVRALIATERLEDAFAFLKFPPDIADRVGALMMRAAVARRLERESAESGAWQEAMLEAERDMTRNHFLKIARAAQSMNRTRIAADALVAACGHPRGLMPPIEEISWLVGYLAKHDRADDLLLVSRRMLSRHSDDPVMMNNAIYLTIVLNGPEAANDNLVSLIEGLATSYPEVVGIRTTLALAYLMAGRNDEAYAVFRPEEFTGIGWQKFNASDRAIFAIALERKDDGKLAANVKQMIDWEEMLEVERIFFRDHLIEEDPRSRRLADADAPAEESPDPRLDGPSRAELLEQRRNRDADRTGESNPRLEMLREQRETEAKAPAPEPEVP